MRRTLGFVFFHGLWNEKERDTYIPLMREPCNDKKFYDGMLKKRSNSWDTMSVKTKRFGIGNIPVETVLFVTTQHFTIK